MASYNSTPTTEQQQLAQQYQQYQQQLQQQQMQQQYQHYQQYYQQPLGPQSQSQQSSMDTSRKQVNHDVPPFSRVFIVCSKSMREEEVREAFSVFGNIEDVWMVKDRMTKENKGICYVKYDKASSAALAIENLDAKMIGSDPKPIKVYIIL